MKPENFVLFLAVQRLLCSLSRCASLSLSLAPSISRVWWGTYRDVGIGHAGPFAHSSLPVYGTRAREGWIGMRICQVFCRRSVCVCVCALALYNRRNGLAAFVWVRGLLCVCISFNEFLWVRLYDCHTRTAFGFDFGWFFCVRVCEEASSSPQQPQQRPSTEKKNQPNMNISRYTCNYPTHNNIKHFVLAHAPRQRRRRGFRRTTIYNHRLAHLILNSPDLFE